MNKTSEQRAVWKRGAKLLRKMVPALKIEVAMDGTEIGPTDVQREARLIAIANRHKPWARRYLRHIGRLM